MFFSSSKSFLLNENVLQNQGNSIILKDNIDFSFRSLMCPFVPDLLQKYLMHCNQTVEFSDFIEGLEVTCQVEYEGSQIYKYIQILVS
jgi:hypothetical protein